VRRFRRRRSGGKREPTYWSRICSVTQGESVLDVTCDDSLVNSGIVLFDPSVGATTNTDTRITLRALHYPIDLAIAQPLASNTHREIIIWGVVCVLNNFDAEAFVGQVDYDTLLNGKDVLDVRSWHFRNNENNVAAAGSTTFTLVDSGDMLRPMFIRAQRKLTLDQKVVFLQGGFQLVNNTTASSDAVDVTYWTTISALWQRTLR